MHACNAATPALSAADKAASHILLLNVTHASIALTPAVSASRMTILSTAQCTCRDSRCTCVRCCVLQGRYGSDCTISQVLALVLYIAQAGPATRPFVSHHCRAPPLPPISPTLISPPPPPISPHALLHSPSISPLPLPPLFSPPTPPISPPVSLVLRSFSPQAWPISPPISPPAPCLLFSPPTTPI